MCNNCISRQRAIYWTGYKWGDNKLVFLKFFSQYANFDTSVLIILPITVVVAMDILVYIFHRGRTMFWEVIIYNLTKGIERESDKVLWGRFVEKGFVRCRNKMTLLQKSNLWLTQSWSQGPLALFRITSSYLILKDLCGYRREKNYHFYLHVFFQLITMKENKGILHWKTQDFLN